MEGSHVLFYHINKFIQPVKIIFVVRDKFLEPVTVPKPHRHQQYARPELLPLELPNNKSCDSSCGEYTQFYVRHKPPPLLMHASQLP